MIAAIELVADKETRAPFDPALKLGMKAQEIALEHQLIVRSLGDSIVVTPPLVINAEEIDTLLLRMRKTLDATLAQLD